VEPCCLISCDLLCWVGGGAGGWGGGIKGTYLGHYPEEGGCEAEARRGEEGGAGEVQGEED